MTVARLPINQAKNRYRDVLPSKFVSVYTYVRVRIYIILSKITVVI